MKQAIRISMIFSFMVSSIALAQGLNVGDKAPCVVLEQQSTDGSQTKGCIRDVLDEEHAFTFVEFFSISCGTCAKNLPVLFSLASELQDNVTLRQISTDRDADSVKDFIADNADNLFGPVAFDNERLATKAYGVRKTPTLFILDRDNTVVYKHQGLLRDSDVEEIKSIVSGE